MYLYAIYQRTQSESKLQHIFNSILFSLICMQSIKEHNMKANHNASPLICAAILLYAIYQRTQYESKSQLLLQAMAHAWSVCNLSKKNPDSYLD